MAQSNDVTTTNKKLSLNERINQIWSTTQGKTYTTAIATIIIVVFMLLFAIVPAYVSITDQISLNEQKSKYLDDLATKQSAINGLITQRDANSVGITLLDLYLKDEINNELLVASFSKVAEDHRCRMNSISFLEPAVTKNFLLINPNIRAISFNWTISCKIGEMVAIYDVLRDFPVPIYVTSITYTNRKDQGGGGTSNFFYDKFVITVSGEYYFWNKIDLTSTTNE